MKTDHKANNISPIPIIFAIILLVIDYYFTKTYLNMDNLISLSLPLNKIIISVSILLISLFLLIFNLKLRTPISKTTQVQNNIEPISETVDRATKSMISQANQEFNSTNDWQQRMRDVEKQTLARIQEKEDQLKKLISLSPFNSTPVLNASEQFLFVEMAKAFQGQPFLMYPQVNLGEFLSNVDEELYKTIQCKRADFCICDYKFNPIAVIEYHGKGHYQGDYFERDQEKKMAIESAGIAYISITHEENLGERVHEIHTFLASITAA